MSGAAGLPGLAGVLLCLTFAACAAEAPPPIAMSDLPENPLPPCRRSSNCVRQTRLFDLSPDTLFAEAQAALEAVGASTLSATPETRRLDAVFTVFVFKDDVTLAVEPHEGGAALHIRSASRLGYRDYGVNRRRVRKFFDTLNDALTPPLTPA